MDSPRLPRFKRVPTVAAIQLEERDRQIIRLVYRHRFLRSDHIISLIGGSQQQLLRRLQLLYHHGYLERPRAQLQYYERGGSRHIAYGLGNKAGALLKAENGFSVHPDSWNEKNHAIGRIYLEHALLVADVMVSIELACRKRGDIQLLYEDKLSPQPIEWHIRIQNGTEVGVIPDRVFALEYQGVTGKTERAYFFLEADRGTMPVKRKRLFQSSFYRKLLRYEATWTQGIHRTKFGFNRFRVLTVTTIPGRVKSLVDACSDLKRGHGLFLFTDHDSLRSQDIFSLDWKTAVPERTSRLLD